MDDSASAKILTVDDDPQIRSLLRRLLEPEGYQVMEAGTGSEARALLQRQEFDLVLLDINLPEVDGLSLAQELRARSDVAIVMVTAKGDDVDRVVGLECGADDYIVKPFNVRETLARVRAILRRLGPRRVRDAGHAGKTYILGDWSLDTAARQLARAGGGRQPERLTGAEFDLLEVFAEHPGRVLSRAALLEMLNGAKTDSLDRSIDILVARIRKKVEDDPGNPVLIKTVWGEGYILGVPVARG